MKQIWMAAPPDKLPAGIPQAKKLKGLLKPGTGGGPGV